MDIFPFFKSTSQKSLKSFLGLFLLVSFLLAPAISFSAERGYDPISVYLNWQSDPRTTMTVQWITELNKDSDEIYYHEFEESEWRIAVGTHIPMPRNEPYLIHRVELTDLKPGKSYVFRIGDWEGTPYKFRTMPDNPDKPFRFVIGGDMYHDGMEYLIETNKQAAKMDPMFALVGGDIAYAGSKYANKPKSDEANHWLRWLIAWKEHMVTPEGYLIPFIPAIGNHDVNGRYDQPKENAAFFYSLFAFPGIQGYNVIDFGDYMSIFVLDSGHTNVIGGNQANWLHHAMAQRHHIPNKFALYHVPAYPAVRKFGGTRNVQIRKHWVPVFEYHGLTAAFENHDHAYKRSKPIMKGKVDPDGVIYMGDGAWGVKKARRPVSASKVWYLAKTQRARHFLLVTIDGNNRFFYGMKPNGDVIDSFAQFHKTTPAPSRLEQAQTR